MASEVNREYWDACYRDESRRFPNDYDGWLDGHALRIRPGDRALDLGCGAGTNLDALLKRGAQVTAADLSPDALRLVRASWGERVAGMDCFDMREGFPYGPDSFGAVVSDLSLHYFSWEDTRKIVGDIRRILRRGGLLMARLHSVDNLDSARAERIEDGYYFVDGCARRYFTADDIRSLFADWQICSLEEKTAMRYGREKRVIEFLAQKP